MNTMLIKGVAALLCAGSAIAMSFKSQSANSETLKVATNVAANSKELVICAPEKSSDYGIGIYRVEGILGKGKKVTISLDDKEVKTLTSNSEDGQYDVDVEVDSAGKHVILAQYEDAKGNLVPLKKEFQASNKKMGGAKVDEPETKNEETAARPGIETVRKLEEKSDEPISSSLLPDDVIISSSDPNSSLNRKAAGAHDDKIQPKLPAGAGKSVSANTASKASNGKAMFTISSHTNFNIVNHGIIQVGGKGHSGDKVLLLIDNKPSMRGTIKPNGRWKFPVKISKAGFRQITAQDLTNRQASVIKLKIK
jgi:hypothetical protein